MTGVLASATAFPGPSGARPQPSSTMRPTSRPFPRGMPAKVSRSPVEPQGDQERDGGCQISCPHGKHPSDRNQEDDVPVEGTLGESCQEPEEDVIEKIPHAKNPEPAGD